MAFQLHRRALTRKTLRMLLSAANTSWGLVLNFWTTYNLSPAVVAAGCLLELARLPPAPRRVCIGRGLAALNSRRHDGQYRRKGVSNHTDAPLSPEDVTM